MDAIAQIGIAIGGGAVSGIIIVSVLYNDVYWIKKTLDKLDRRVEILEGKVK